MGSKWLVMCPLSITYFSPMIVLYLEESIYEAKSAITFNGSTSEEEKLAIASNAYQIQKKTNVTENITRITTLEEQNQLQKTFDITKRIKHKQRSYSFWI